MDAEKRVARGQEGKRQTPCPAIMGTFYLGEVIQIKNTSGGGEMVQELRAHTALTNEASFAAVGRLTSCDSNSR